ncbi:MAG: hypothetical protein V3T70_05525 [Phycisphaerae bacterium]
MALSVADIRFSHPELAAIIEAWPTLPEAVKVGIVAMVNTAMREQANTR